MINILDRIIATKRVEIECQRQQRPLSELQARVVGVQPPRDFFSAINARPAHGIHLIAEMKRASPSAGLILEDYDPANIARAYHRHGASALSVLTDQTFFQGSLAHIGAVKRVVPLPVLRKDFLIDPYQIYESREAGADAVLLIADVLNRAQIAELHGLAETLGMTTLVESHGADALAMVLDMIRPAGGNRFLLGINNRDLAAQATSLDVTKRLSALLPADVPFVAESGIETRHDVLAMQSAGAAAVLVGESLLRSPNLGAHVERLLGIVV